MQKVNLPDLTPFLFGGASKISDSGVQRARFPHSFFHFPLASMTEFLIVITKVTQ
jgi:hypothetical protein